MVGSSFRFIVRTPHDVVLDTRATSVRVLAESGHVGIRAHMEPIVLPIESGLLLVRGEGRVAFVGSGGGLLFSDGREATLLTPLAVTGMDPIAIQGALDDMLAAPDGELVFRTRLGKLEGRILAELRHGPSDDRPGTGERR